MILAEFCEQLSKTKKQAEKSPYNEGNHIICICR